MHTPQPKDRRQYPRTRVTWPIVVHAGATRYMPSGVDISRLRAKARTTARLRVGTAANLGVVPPEGPPLRVRAMVWRVDPDGPAFLFSTGIKHRLLRAHEDAVVNG